MTPPVPATHSSRDRHIDSDHPGRYSSSLVAGLAMLRCFTGERPVRGIADMSDEIGFARATACRYAATLVQLGYLEQTTSRKYRLSARGANIGLCLLNSMTVRNAAREHLRHLRNRIGHTVSLGMHAGSEVLYIDQLRGSRLGQYAIDVVMGPGTRQPVYCTAAGKALLALLPAAEQRDVIVNLTLTQIAPSTLASTKALRVELARIAAADGVVVEDEELLADRRALAATVLDSDRWPVAAVEVAVPSTAYTVGELVEHVGPIVSETAGQISAALGH
jgi:IclR family pca regulon transcriptional regulator